MFPIESPYPESPERKEAILMVSTLSYHMERRNSAKKGKNERPSQNPKNSRIFLFKVVQSNGYGMVRGFPYRVLAVDESSTLYSLAQAIIDSFDFEFDHPFGFYNNLTRYYNSTVSYELFADLFDTRGEVQEGVKGVRSTRVSNVFTEIGQKMLFLFDYGDEWHFRVTFTDVVPGEAGKKYPCIIKSVGEARPQYDEPDEYDDLLGIDEDEDGFE